MQQMPGDRTLGKIFHLCESSRVAAAVSAAKNSVAVIDAATTIILNRHFLRGSLSSKAGDGTLLQSISVLSIFAPL